MSMVTVAVISYNPNLENICNTLKSIIWQRNVDFEIVVADDGSEADLFDIVNQYLKENGFTKYKLIKNKKNQGIIKNVLSALSVAEGKYIKLLSPGDFLYDENTLEKYVNFAEKNNAVACFSNIYPYTVNKNKEIKLLTDIRIPKNLSAWLKYDLKKIKKNYFIYLDFICGASLIYNTQVFTNYINEISVIANWAEDMVLIYMIANDEPVFYMPDSGGVWYEFGNGVSTQGNTLWAKRLYEDCKNIFHLMIKKRLMSCWIYKAHFSNSFFWRFFYKIIHEPFYYFKRCFFKTRIFNCKNIEMNIENLNKILN